jgi:hypothetical protein
MFVKLITKTMKESGKFNLIIGMLITLIILFVSTFVIFLTPINFRHTASFKTIAITSDWVKVKVNYTVTYKAPLIIPDEMKRDALGKMCIYGNIRIGAFVAQHKAIALKETDLRILRVALNSTDTLGDIIKSLNIPEISDKIDKIKQIEIIGFDFDPIFERMFKNREKAKHDADSIRNVLIVLRQDADLIRLQADYRASQIMLESTIQQDIGNSYGAPQGSFAGVEWEVVKYDTIRK